MALLFAPTGQGERLSPFGRGEGCAMSTSMAVSSVRVGGRRCCRDECDGCFFSSRHCRKGSGSVFSKGVLLISCDDSVGCNGGEGVGLSKGTHVDRNEVLLRWPRRDFYHKLVSAYSLMSSQLTYLVPIVTKSILLPRPFRKNRGHSSVSTFVAENLFFKAVL